MNKMNITNAKYFVNFLNENAGIKCTINGEEVFVPLTLDNRYYKEIMQQVNAGNLTIADAD